MPGPENAGAGEAGKDVGVQAVLSEAVVAKSVLAKSVLAKAVTRGILSPTQAEQLAALAREEEAAARALAPSATAAASPPALAAPLLPADVAMLDATSPDDEKLRFIGGFNDIFVTIGIGLFLGAWLLLLGDYAGRIVVWGSAAVASWLLAELFTRRRRMALPSIVLLVSFSASVFLTFLWLMLPLATGQFDERFATLYPSTVESKPWLTMLAALLSAACVGLHYWRFRVPITVAAGTATLAIAALAALAGIAPGWAEAHMNGLLLATGLCVFALAMRFDLSDPGRLTRRTDIAFWLHLLAAPLIVHPLLTNVIGGSLGDMGRIDGSVALAVLAIFLGLGLVALVIDRRAILVSGMLYAGFAFHTLISGAARGDDGLYLSILALGGFVLVISALWRPLRNGLLRLLPRGIARRLPHSTLEFTS